MSKIYQDVYRYVRSLARRQIVLLYSYLLQWWHCYPLEPNHKTALIVAPHQDDETLGCGGTIALKRQQGIAVSVVFLTDGQRSHPHHSRVSPAELVQIRKSEAIKALSILGVSPSDIHFLDRMDGSLSQLAPPERDAIVNCLVDLLQALQPQEVYVTYRHDVQLDHEAAHNLIQAAILKTKLPIDLWQYPIWTRWYPWQLDRRSPELRNAYCLFLKQEQVKKREALQAYESQFLPIPPDSSALLPGGFVDLFLTAEIFFKSPPG